MFIRRARRKGVATEISWYAGGLVIAAGVYVAFGLVLGGPPLGFELIQLAVFLGVALAGLRYSPLILAAGWLFHSIWDAMHVLPALSQHAPHWYVFACLAFDVPLAVYIAVRRRSFPLSRGILSSATEPVHPE